MILVLMGSRSRCRKSSIIYSTQHKLTTVILGGKITYEKSGVKEEKEEKKKVGKKGGVVFLLSSSNGKESEYRKKKLSDKTRE